MGGIPTIAAYGLPTEAELPADVAGWRADPARAVLLVHDMQRYFLRPLPEPTRGDLLHRAVRLRAACAAAGVPVVYTRQPGGMTDSQRGLLRAFWGAGMRTTPEDREIVPELAPAPGDTVLDKWRYSAFARTDLLDRLRSAGRDQLVVCGVYAHVGVLVTAIEAFSHDLETFLAADATADFSQRHHRMALDYAAARCAVVAGTGSLIDDLRPAVVAS